MVKPRVGEHGDIGGDPRQRTVGVIHLGHDRSRAESHAAREVPNGRPDDGQWVCTVTKQCRSNERRHRSLAMGTSDTDRDTSSHDRSEEIGAMVEPTSLECRRDLGKIPRNR